MRPIFHGPASATPEPPVSRDQRIGRAIVPWLGIAGALQFRQYPPRECLAQFHAPLVEGVDAPDGALGEDQVLVEGHQGTQHGGGEALGHEETGGAVAGEGLVGGQRLGHAFGLHFLQGFPEGQGLGLGQHVGDQQIVVAAQGVQALGEGDEIAGDEIGRAHV